MDSLRNYSFALAVLILLLIGCAPLQQAPLVYGSKVSLGITVSGQTTAQPSGVSLNIGYEQIDTAYVPVMVAKECDKSDSTNALASCTNDIYKLRDVTATNDVGDSGGSRMPSEEVKDLIEKLQKSQQDRMEAERNLKAAASDRKSAQDDAARAGSDTTKKAESSNALNAAIKKEEDAEEAKRLADDRYKKLLADLSLVSNKKRDAYSVFGTFAADTQVGVGSGQASTNLKIGKVFSTGVASQNLTEGLRAYYQTSGGSQCLAAAKDLVAAYEKSLSSARADQNTTGGTGGAAGGQQNPDATKPNPNTTGGSTEGQQNPSAAKTDKSTSAQTAAQATAGQLTDEEKKKKVETYYQMVIKACDVKQGQ